MRRMGLTKYFGRAGQARLPSMIGAAALGALALLLVVDATGRAGRDTKLLIVLGAFAIMLTITVCFGWSIDRAWARARRSAERRVSSFNDEFVARVSHQLRTPLTSIVGYAQLIEARTDEDTEAVTTVIAQSVELSCLVDDLTTTARLDANLLSIEPRPVAVGDAIATATAFVDLLGTSVDVDCREADVLVDPDVFRHVVRNLLFNAHRHGRPPITVRGQPTEDRYVLQVVDEGPGIPAGVESAMFGRFVHGDDDDPGHRAVGLGLAVAQELTELMGGEIAYRRFQGETHFILDLPLVRSRRRRSLRSPTSIGAVQDEAFMPSVSLTTTRR